MKIKLRPAAKKAGSMSPTTATRNALAAKDQALPDGGYPVPDVNFLKRAIQSIGRTPSEKRPALIAYLRKRAKALGATDLLTKGALAMSREEYKSLLELAGVLAGGGDVLPQGTAVNKGSGADKKPPVSKVKASPLKTAKGKAIYAQLCGKGYPPALAMKAAQKAEQGLKVGEMANVPPGDVPGSKDADGDTDGDTPADVAAKKKLGLKNRQALAVYKKARKKGLPHPMAIKAAKFKDKTLGDPKARAAKEMASSPKG